MNWSNTGVFLLILGIVFGTNSEAQEKTAKKAPPVKMNSGTRIKYIQPKDRSYLATSRAKDEFIQKTIKAHIDLGEDIARSAVAKAIMSDIAAEIPMNPKRPLDARTTKDLTEIARKRIEKNFPKPLAQLKQELTDEAEKRFIQYKRNEHITVKYYRGPRVIAVSGPFYAFDGRTVKVGSRTIPYYDVLPEDKIKIDKKYSDAKREEFISSNYNTYRDKRSEALMKELNALKDAQDNANERAGYICLLDNWHTAAKLTEAYIELERRKIFAPDKTKSNDDTEILVFDVPNETQLVTKIRDTKTEVNSQQGIDADPAYSPAFWDFTRGEARLALQLEKYSVMATKEYDFFVTPNRLIRNIQLDYIDNKLARVITFYTRITLADFVKIKQQYIDRYGKDDLMINNPKEADKDRIRPLTWTGKNTIAKLLLNFGDEEEVVNGALFVKEKKGAYSETDSMVLNKENEKPATPPNKAKK